jgi:hypothetical protein
MSSLTVLIIRHGEKPDKGWPGPGTTPDGNSDPKSLVIRGWQRAGAWSVLFGSELSNPDYPKPNIIYAANPNGENPDTSQRPLQTVTPLAEKLGLDPVKNRAVGQEEDLVADVLAQSGVVLIAWEHKAIAPGILRLLAKGQELPNMPTKWKGTRFDVVLRLDRSSSDSQWSSRQLFPCLLSGDSAAPMP